MIYHVERCVYLESGDIFESETARYVFKENEANNDEILIIAFAKPHMKKYNTKNVRNYNLKKENVIDFIKQFNLKFVQNILKI